MTYIYILWGKVFLVSDALHREGKLEEDGRFRYLAGLPRHWTTCLVVHTAPIFKRISRTIGGGRCIYDRFPLVIVMVA